MDQVFLDEGEKHPVLGPHYFVARKTADDVMEKIEPEHFEPLIKKVSEDVYSALLESLQSHLIFDAASNIQGTIWRQIDDSVRALLGGERWALDRYALGERYDCEKIRAAVAKHIPQELQDARMKDLEAENERLRKDIEYHRQFR